MMMALPRRPELLVFFPGNPPLLPPSRNLSVLDSFVFDTFANLFININSIRTYYGYNVFPVNTLIIIRCFISLPCVILNQNSIRSMKIDNLFSFIPSGLMPERPLTFVMGEFCFKILQKCAPFFFVRCLVHLQRYLPAIHPWLVCHLLMGRLNGKWKYPKNPGFNLVLLWIFLSLPLIFRY